MMEIIDHGEWVTYVPDPYPIQFLKHNVLFCQRVSDQMDWYKFQKQLLDPDTIKMTVDNMHNVQATTADPSMLFPASMRVLEVKGVDVATHETFRRKRFDLANKRFLEAPPLPVTMVQFLTALHHYGMLGQWRDHLDKLDDVPLQIALTYAQHFNFDDQRLQTAARAMRWSESTLRQVFDRAREL